MCAVAECVLKIPATCGTRGGYVAGCRCPSCRAANTRYVQERERAFRAAAREAATGVVVPAPQTWTAPDGSKRIRVYQRACAGVDGVPCPFGSHLRKDSSGDLCERCRRRLIWNGFVDAGEVLAHLRKLSRQGVGYKSVADAASLARSTLAHLLAGRRTRIRAQAAKRVLAIDRGARAGGALVKAGPTWRRIRRLLSEGFTKTELARRLGSRAQTPALQLRTDYVTARRAADVERLYRIVMRI